MCQGSARIAHMTTVNWRDYLALPGSGFRQANFARAVKRP